jgi:hypothetical protein
MSDPRQPIIDAATKAFTEKLIAEGKLIEAGWIAMKAMAIPPDAPDYQLEEMRNAFFAGAQHLFGSLMNLFDPEGEPTDEDVRKVEKINDELNVFITDFIKQHGL